MKRKSRKERWKDIPGYKGQYQISNKTRVKSLARWVNHPRHGKYFRCERIMSPKIDWAGYYLIKFSHNKVRKEFRIHRLVAKAFVKNPRNLNEVNHLDGDKLNNLPENLEWCTHPENIEHAVRTGLTDKKGMKHHGCKLTNNKVLRIRKLYSNKKLNQYELADKYGVTPSTICEIVNRKRWKHI